MLCTKTSSRFSFNLAPRIVQVATRAARVKATRCHSTVRQRLRYMRQLCAAPRKLKANTYAMLGTKTLSRFGFNLAPRIVHVATIWLRSAAVRRRPSTRWRRALLPRAKSKWPTRGLPRAWTLNLISARISRPRALPCVAAATQTQYNITSNANAKQVL